jgi:hypothetical protein
MLRWFDGFEQYGAAAQMLEGVGGGAAWSENSGWTLSTTSPATGTYHMRMTPVSNGSRKLRRIFGQAKQITGFGYRFNIADLPDSEGLTSGGGAVIMADIRDVSNDSHFVIIMGTDGSVQALRGANITNQELGGTVLGRSDPCIAAGGYHHFEMKSKIDNSTGYIEVRINEVTVLNLTGIDTQSTVNATAAQVVIGQSGGPTTTGNPSFTTFDMDDVYAWDDDSSDAENTVVDFIGDKGCYYLPVDGDTAEADWTLSTGFSGFALLDEVPPSGTDYVSDTTGAARSIFTVAALPGGVAEVIAMMPVIYARKEDSGSVSIRGGVVVGVDESYSPTNSPSTAYAYMEPGPKTIDPDTGVAWANTANPDLLIERTV